MCPLQSTHTSPWREHPHIFCANLQSLPALSATPRKPTILPPHVRPHFTRKKTFGGVVQVAALLCGADGEVLSTLACLVRPGLKAIQPGATKVHGITQAKANAHGLEASPVLATDRR